jgi:hypothetical protein
VCWPRKWEAWCAWCRLVWSNNDSVIGRCGDIDPGADGTSSVIDDRYAVILYPAKFKAGKELRRSSARRYIKPVATMVRSCRDDRSTIQDRLIARPDVSGINPSIVNGVNLYGVYFVETWALCLDSDIDAKRIVVSQETLYR